MQLMSWPGCLLVLLWISNHMQCSFGDTPDMMVKMKAVKDKIFRDYDKSVRPTNGTNTTEVFSALIPRQIVDLDEEKAIFTLDSYFFMHWFDPRLQWNVSDYEGYLQLPREMLWVPDITVHNSHSAQVDPTHDVLLAIHWSGTVSWFPPILTQTSCPSVSKTPYPQDEVECTVVMGSWTHDGWEIDFSVDPEMHLYEFININPRWELIESRSSVERNETYYECCPEPYLSIHARFPMRRRPVPEIEATRSPCILVMALTLSIFWLPSDSSKKLLLGGMLFLVLNVLLTYVAWSTRCPLNVLYAVSFLQTAMYIIVVTLLLQVFVVIKIASFSGLSRPPAIVVHFLKGPLGKYLLLRLPLPEDKLPLDGVQLKDDSASQAVSASEEWKMLASSIDRFLFVLMLVVMLVIHHL